MSKDVPVAGLLAPVPLDHLTDGVEVCREQGKVAFGTRVWETFRDLETEAGIGAPVLIYASHSDEHLGPMASWRGRYAGWVPAVVGVGNPEGARYRPPSTQHGDEDRNWWLGFWEVTDLERLPVVEHVPIASLHDRKGRKYARSFVPEGPILISSTG